MHNTFESRDTNQGVGRRMKKQCARISVQLSTVIYYGVVR